MKISELITEESHRYEVFYGHKPEYIFLGHRQLTEIDEMVAEMGRFGLLIRSSEPPPRATYRGMQIFRVDADSHLSFGVAQPSPCG